MAEAKVNPYERAARQAKVRSLLEALAVRDVPHSVAKDWSLDEAWALAESAGCHRPSRISWEEVLDQMPDEPAGDRLFDMMPPDKPKKLRRSRADMALVADPFLANLVERNVEAHLCGSWRRASPTCGDLDLVVVGAGQMSDLNLPKEFGGTTAGTVRMARSLAHPTGGWVQVDVWLCPPDMVGPFLCFATGPAGLNIAQRTHALKMGLMLSQHGLFDGEGHRVDDGTERGVYEALGWPWVEPTERDRWQRHPQP